MTDNTASGGLSENSPARELVIKLKDWRTWYARSVKRYYGAWAVGTLGVIALTSASSLVAALNLPSEYQRPLTIILPALASLVSTALVQFKVFENWHLRESGRLDFEKLIAEAKSLPRDSDPATLEEIRRVFLKAIDIERVQASEYFSNLSALMGEKGEREGGSKEKPAPDVSAPGKNTDSQGRI
ncbi:MAG TPA: hypothetical protein VM639_12645 [Dongiaceae bacterium]|nr:hypothetical protein [Dongiaceae bacterium]